ncbi:ATP-binding cassette domain-containing protein [Brevibacterium daeguense]|uniref:ATP-binding cassette domain-containing protein n=1 Tax=Brevibacterium daeguense TaxID=909936 RepID=A0ABP8EHH7_9MICO
MLTLKGITVKSGRKTWLKDVSLTAEARRITGVVGPRGSGKTELIRVIMGLIEADSGSVSLEGHKLGFGDRQNFGYLPAERGGYPNMKVLEQIVYFSRLHGMTLGAAERNAVTLLARLDLSDRAYAPLSNLSGTEVARVDIASVLAADPDVVVLDEPFEGLDATSAEKVFELLRDHADSGVPVIFTSDNWNLTQAAADDIVVLSHGTILEQGTLSELRADHITYQVELAAGPDADLAEAQLASAVGVTEVTREGSTLRFAAVHANAAGEAVRDLAGLRGFTAVEPSLAELFKEKV